MGLCGGYLGEDLGGTRGIWCRGIWCNLGNGRAPRTPGYPCGLAPAAARTGRFRAP